jgi:hypothetical protein
MQAGDQEGVWYDVQMSTKALMNLLQRAESWPKEAQDELIEIAQEIEGELRGGEYQASREELRAIDAAIASVDRGEIATDEQVRTAFAKFRSA